MSLRPWFSLAIIISLASIPAFAQISADPPNKRGIELRARKWVLPPPAETGGFLGDAASRRRQQIYYQTKPADTKADTGETYGHVTVVLSELVHGGQQGRHENFGSLLESLAEYLVGIFDTKEGTYLLAVDLYDHAANRIASEPLITATVKEKRFLWFVVERSLERKEQIITQPLRFYEVTTTTNKITAILTAHYTSKQAFDAESYKKAIDTYKSFGPVLALEPITDTTSAVLNVAKSFADLIVSRKELSKEIRQIDLNFADMRGEGDTTTPLPKYVKFQVPDEIERRDGKVVAVTLDLALSSSKFGALSGIPSPRTILQNAEISIGSKQLSLRNFLKENGAKDLQALVTALEAFTLNEQKDGKYTLANLGAACGRLGDALYALFNNKDAAYLQWAFLTEYWSQFSQRTEPERAPCYPDAQARGKYQLPLPK